MTAPATFALLPRDGFFCKDGRDWFTSASGRGHGLPWPWPSTVLGALRTAWGRELEATGGAPMDADAWRRRTAGITLGRSLVLRRSRGAVWSPDHRVWPVPSDARWLEGHDEVARLLPAPPVTPTLGREDDDVLEALWVATPAQAAKPRRAPRWWSERSFVRWLAGDPVADSPADQPDQGRRLQAHVKIRPSELTAADGALFQHDVVETLEHDADWFLGVEVTLPGGDVPALATLGSDRRLARVEALPAAIFQPPDRVLQAFATGRRGLRLVAATLACFQRGWLPDGLERRGVQLRGHLPGLEPEVVLRAAMVPRPVPVSGWDMAAGAPKPVARMVAPGSVYFFERADGRVFGEREARALWLAAVGDRTGEGFGRVVPGTWELDRS